MIFVSPAHYSSFNLLAFFPLYAILRPLQQNAHQIPFTLRICCLDLHFYAVFFFHHLRLGCHFEYQFSEKLVLLWRRNKKVTLCRVYVCSPSLFLTLSFSLSLFRCVWVCVVSAPCCGCENVDLATPFICFYCWSWSWSCFYSGSSCQLLVSPAWLIFAFAFVFVFAFGFGFKFAFWVFHVILTLAVGSS